MYIHPENPHYIQLVKAFGEGGIRRARPRWLGFGRSEDTPTGADKAIADARTSLPREDHSIQSARNNRVAIPLKSGGLGRLIDPEHHVDLRATFQAIAVEADLDPREIEIRREARQPLALVMPSGKYLSKFLEFVRQ